ncbi:MAG: cold shock protein [Verrucomicrobiota bacterium]
MKFLRFWQKSGSGWLARSVDSMAKGTVKWFNEKKGFGFIVDPEVPTDVFVHFSVIQADGFKTLNEGENVEYELYQDEKGAKARNVVRV